MFKVEGKRGSGKTTKLIKLCKENNYALVEPSTRMAVCAAQTAKHIGCPEVNVISFYDMIQPGVMPDQKFVIDELDIALAWLGVVGYSNTVGEKLTITSEEASNE